MSSIECAICGLAPCDLPDEVDPDLIFETEDGVTHCMHCVAHRHPDDEPGQPVQDVQTGGLL